MPALRRGNECRHGRSSAASGQRGAKSAQFFGGVVRAEIVERCMKVSRRRQHPQANHDRQHDAQALLQSMVKQCEGWPRHCHIRNQPDGGAHDITRLCSWKRPTGVLTCFDSIPFTRTMSGDRQHLLLRHRCLKKWAAAFAVVALVAWIVEFASHLHIDHESKVSAQNSHFCEMCAAFQAGASGAATVQIIPKLRPVQLRAVASASFPRLQFTCSYRSRAPPHA